MPIRFFNRSSLNVKTADKNGNARNRNANNTPFSDRTQQHIRQSKQ